MHVIKSKTKKGRFNHYFDSHTATGRVNTVTRKYDAPRFTDNEVTAIIKKLGSQFEAVEVSA